MLNRRVCSGGKKSFVFPSFLPSSSINSSLEHLETQLVLFPPPARQHSYRMEHGLMHMHACIFTHTHTHTQSLPPRGFIFFPPCQLHVHILRRRIALGLYCIASPTLDYSLPSPCSGIRGNVGNKVSITTWQKEISHVRPRQLCRGAFWAEIKPFFER